MQKKTPKTDSDMIAIRGLSARSQYKINALVSKVDGSRDIHDRSVFNTDSYRHNFDTAHQFNQNRKDHIKGPQDGVRAAGVSSK
jgi:hypothetical protein